MYAYDIYMYVRMYIYTHVCRYIYVPREWMLVEAYYVYMYIYIYVYAYFHQKTELATNCAKKMTIQLVLCEKMIMCRYTHTE